MTPFVNVVLRHQQCLIFFSGYTSQIFYTFTMIKDKILEADIHGAQRTDPCRTVDRRQLTGEIFKAHCPSALGTNDREQ